MTRVLRRSSGSYLRLVYRGATAFADFLPPDGRTRRLGSLWPRSVSNHVSSAMLVADYFSVAASGPRQLFQTNDRAFHRRLPV